MAYLGSDDPVTIRAPRDLRAGAPLLVGSLFLVTLHAAREGHQVSARASGGFCLPIEDGARFGVGEPVYFDTETELLCKRRKGLPCVGVSIEETPEGGRRVSFLIRQPRIG